MSMENLLGSFVWHELMTTDTESASAFFGKVAGWKTQGWAVDPGYKMFMRENRNKMRSGPSTTVTRDAEAEPALLPSSVSNAAAATPAAFSAMFDGPADLAMQRKMENKQ